MQLEESKHNPIRFPQRGVCLYKCGIERYIASLDTVYANITAAMNVEITDDTKKNADTIYSRTSSGGDTFSGGYESGGEQSVDLDVSTFVNPEEKNNLDLVTYAIHACESGWGYVWGTYGSVLTESLFEYKLEQYPDGVGNYEDFIRENWLGGRTTDCVGLIKDYGWLNPDSLTIDYGTNGMPDVGADQMYKNATVKGDISTMPDRLVRVVAGNGLYREKIKMRMNKTVAAFRHT